MFAYGEPLSSDRPFWFANENLLLDLLRVEIRSISELFASHPDLREFFDAPEATPQQRASCFAVLAHRKLMDAIYETFAGRHEQSPSLGDDEKHALELARNLVAPDAPAWVLETNEVVELLPYRINAVLPEPLREGRFKENNSAQVESVKSLSNVEQIRALTEGVLDQQLRRLEQRWSVVGPAANPSRAVVVQGRESKKRKRNRTRDKQRMLRDNEISGIDD